MESDLRVLERYRLRTRAAYLVWTRGRRGWVSYAIAVGTGLAVTILGAILGSLRHA
jgi:hypothetical protein